MLCTPSDPQLSQPPPFLRGAMVEATEAPPLQPLHLIDEITHRVVNEYTEAICALGLAAAAAADVQARAALAAAARRLHAQVEAHRALQSPFAEGPTDLADYIGEVCARLARAPLADAGVRLTVDADEVWLDADRAWRVGLIVAELVRNAARHGLRGRTGSIRVEITEAARRVACRVCDDGDGVVGVSVGRGRQLVQALAAELGGTVRWSFTPAGCSVRLSFPAVRPLHLSEPGQGPSFRLSNPQPPRHIKKET